MINIVISELITIGKYVQDHVPDICLSYTITPYICQNSLLQKL